MSTKTRRGRTCQRDLEHERELIDKERREDRKDCADHFRTEYYYCKCQDHKNIVWSGGRRHKWFGDSCGITWAGVHGKNWICVVTKTGDLDLSRVNGYLRLDMEDEVFCQFRRAAISELEDLADLRSELHSTLGKRIKTPFGVVSVAALPGKDHKVKCKYKETKFMKLMVGGLIKEIEGVASSAESKIDEESDVDACTLYLVESTLRAWRALPDNIPGFDNEKSIWVLQKEMEKGKTDESVEESSDKYYDTEAIEFLRKKMKKPVNYFTPVATVKTAISAFQRLCNKNFNADEIQVSVMDPDYFILPSEDKDAYVKHLETVEIEQYLSDMKDQKEEWMVTEKVTEKVTNPHREKRFKHLKGKQIGRSKGKT